MIISKRLHSGFTLIELSIVLVIIGLLAGGILVGRHLIDAAEISKQISQVTKISQALNAFRLKYNAIPGDIYATADDFGFNPGNDTGQRRDNGIIEDMMPSSPIHGVWYEPVYFFAHLVEAGLLPSDFLRGTNQSSNPARQGLPCQVFTGGDPLTGEGTYYRMALNPNAGMIAQTYKGYIWIYLGISDCARDGDFPHPDRDPVITPPQAYAIDTKTDDGIPGTGSTLAMENEDFLMSIDDGIPPDSVHTAGHCVTDPTSSAYSVQNNTYQCRLMIRLQ